MTPLWRAHAPFRLGEFELNVAPHRLLRNGSEVEMTAKELKLLAHFVARQGRALALQRRPQRRVGHAAFVTPRSIDRCVTTLRAKMESSRNARSIFRPFGTSDTVLIPAPSEPVSRMAA
ncbi:MAG: winged helix-turn-helix domain-containing protein [Bryobacteraceae bacterium]